MSRSRFVVEQIMPKLCEAEVGLAKGLTLEQVAKKLGVTVPTYCR